MECLKCIIKRFYKLVFKFDQFLDLKLAYLLKYWQICDFTPLDDGHFWLLHAIILSLRLNKKNTDTRECLKCIIKCLYQLVFKFDQFLNLKLAYFLNYCQICNFRHFLALACYYSLSEGKIKKSLTLWSVWNVL